QLGGPSSTLRDTSSAVTPDGNNTRISCCVPRRSKYASGPSSEADGNEASPTSSVSCVATPLARSTDQRQKCPVRFDANTTARPSAVSSGSIFADDVLLRERRSRV